jgi:hypothetical protein
MGLFVLQIDFLWRKYNSSMSKPLIFKKISDVGVKFNNAFIGKARFLDIKISNTDYFFTCHKYINDFSAKILISLKIGEFDSILALKSCVDLKLFDERFAEIDLELLPEEIRLDVAAMVFKNLLTDLSSKLKLDISITSIAFSAHCDAEFEHEIGWSVYDANSAVILCGNLRVGTKLLDAIVSSFEELPANAEPKGKGVSFDVFLEAGRTELSQEEFDYLEISDIVFLDDDSHVRSGTFVLCGIDSPKITGKFEGSSFKISNVVGAS